MDDLKPSAKLESKLLDHDISRRALLKAAGTLGLAGFAAPLLSLGRFSTARAASRPVTPIEHIVVDMQENRSFDHYYGFAPFAGRYGVPRGYSQPDGNGGSVQPFHFTSLSTPDIGHGWNATHSEFDAGRMDGFFTTNGINSMGYYLQADLPFYYSLFNDFTLCTNYFCSLMGPT